MGTSLCREPCPTNHRKSFHRTPKSQKSCWTKPIPASVAVARPVPIATARSANVHAAQKTAITAHVPAARSKSTKMQEKKKKSTNFYYCHDKKNILTWILIKFE